EKYLIYLLEQEKLMPEQLISWGIYRQEIVLWILEQNVRSAVVRLEERKQKPTMNAVSREMGRGTRFLNNLVRRNPKIAKQLKSWGVKKRRFYIKVLEIQVNQALARIEERKEVPHMEAVSLEMGRPGNYLSMLVMENKVKPVDLESWGVRKGHVIHIDAIETEVRAAVARLSEKNQKPSMRAVALEMGHSNQEYLYRLITEKHVTANDLKSWGVKKRPFDIRILEAEIRAAVEKLTKEEDAPYSGAVSQKIGHGKNYIRGLLSKKKITWEQLESWGVKKEQFDIKILEKKVRAAVAELRMLSQKRTMAAVSLKMGYWQGYLSVLLGDGSVEERELRSWGVVVRIKRFDGRALTNCARREL
ncbi:MAG: hypothetical protein Q8N76_01050, partial [Candidatus Omnitrophota bacterium]|nr:hypothetical protein [Candidatus Omnitrophota bacterium]